MTIEEHLRNMIGDLVLTVAKLSADLDALKAHVAALPLVPKSPDNEPGAPN